MNTGKDKYEIDDIGCLEAINGLYAYLDGEMDDKESIAKIEHHMGHCRNCYSRIELETALTERIKKSAKNEVPKKLRERLRNLMDNF